MLNAVKLVYKIVVLIFFFTHVNFILLLGCYWHIVFDIKIPIVKGNCPIITSSG